MNRKTKHRIKALLLAEKSGLLTAKEDFELRLLRSIYPYARKSLNKLRGSKPIFYRVTVNGAMAICGKFPKLWHNTNN